MPPLLSARTCWIAGWVALLVGLVASFVPLDSILSRAPGEDAVTFFLALVRISDAVLHLGLVLLVAAVVVRHVERLQEGPGGGSQEPGAEPGPRDHVDLDEVGGADVDPDPDPDPGPGHR